MIKNNKQNGFTIIELLIATTVFSVILLAASASLIQVGRMYYKGVITSRTQNAARSVADDISRTLQFTSGKVSGPTTTDGTQYVLCVGDVRYTFVKGFKVNDSQADGVIENTSTNHQIRHGLWRDNVTNGSCDNDLSLAFANPYQSIPDLGGSELLDGNMRVKNIDLAPINVKGDAYELSVGVAYGDDDLLNNPTNPTGCKSTLVGGQWCALAEYTTQIYRRVE